MYPTPNLGLVAWDQSTDFFDYNQLSADWATLDNHDHSNGRGLQIGTASIVAGAITSALLAPQAVTQAKIANQAVGTTQLANQAVGSAQIANQAVGSGQIANGAVGYTQLDPNVLPLGSVILWYRQPGAANTPAGGWEIMDGRAWSTITNSLGYTTGNIPDMRGSVPRGAALSGTGTAPGNPPDFGQHVGGDTVSFSHSHTVASHNHVVPAHLHAIAGDGSHQHAWNGGSDVHSRRNAWIVGSQFTDSGSGFTRSNTLESLYIAGFNSAPGGGYDAAIRMDAAGVHSHGGITGVTAASDGSVDGSGRQTTSSSAPGTDSQLGTVDIRSSSIGLLFIMRVR